MAHKIIKDFAGSPDGRYVVDYKAGEIVDLTPSLAEVAVKEGWAKEIKEVKPKPKTESPVEADPAESKGD